MDRKSVRVKIFGSEYPLRGESEEFTKKVAGYVDTMISSIHDKIPEQPPLTISVLAALNITEDLLKEKDKNREMIGNFENEIVKISNYLDTSLQGSGWFFVQLMQGGTLTSFRLDNLVRTVSHSQIH